MTGARWRPKASAKSQRRVGTARFDPSAMQLCESGPAGHLCFATLQVPSKGGNSLGFLEGKGGTWFPSQGSCQQS
ncbi:hypothetical protein DAETH_35630 (plasmid) [Deinococcus aetherius]|uniref:Uncharacterized protein n=1 Tax=Deinococcus aetherius TaxID=200252 RepID=A0ABM8AIE7_9DEIO|nr:hypothetical protein DAETH_35630 [Deinococcus aetherius]